MSDNSDSEKQKTSSDEDETESEEVTDTDESDEDDEIAGDEEEDSDGGLVVQTDVAATAALDAAKRVRHAQVHMTPTGHYAAMRNTGDMFSLGKRNPWELVNPCGVHPNDPTQSIFAYDLSALPNTVEAKPWTEPGADITQWFNYGFTEHTWEKYRKKMLKVIADKNFEKAISVYIDTAGK